MKKILSILAICCICSAAVAQEFTDIDQIREGWTKKTITGVKNDKILTLVTAFNKVWNTQPATFLLKNPVHNEEGDEYNTNVDKDNGYVAAYELGDDGESFSARVWKRTNGHSLFAYMFQRLRGMAVHQIILFYDYDPAKKTLTPEQNEVTRFKPSYDHPKGPIGLALTYQLPCSGEDLVVQEYFTNWYTYIQHVYEWDGMNLQFSKVKFEKKNAFSREYYNMYNEEVIFTNYMLYDFDGDEEPELWLADESEDTQAIFSMTEGKINMIACTYYKISLAFRRNAVGTAGSCGTGCFETHYTVLKDSKPIHEFDDHQEWDFDKDEMVHTYALDDKELSQSQGKKFLDSLGEGCSIYPKFRPLYHRLK